MRTMPLGRLLLTMALPLVISMLVQALYNVVDSIYVSRISESAVTALSPGIPRAESAHRLRHRRGRGRKFPVEQILGGGE